MDWDDFKARRAQAIQQMQDLLDETEPLGLNAVLVFLLGTPVVFFNMFKTGIFLVIGAVIACSVMLWRIVMTPFLAMYFMVDMTLIAFWYLGQIAKRTSEEMK